MLNIAMQAVHIKRFTNNREDELIFEPVSPGLMIMGTGWYEVWGDYDR